MKIFLDENLAPLIARGFNEFEKYEKRIEVHSTIEYFQAGVQDEELLAEIGESGGVLISKDLAMYKTPLYKTIIVEKKVGVIFLQGVKKYDYWQMLHLFFKKWDKYKKLIRKMRPPFAVIASIRSDKFEPVDL